MINMSHRIVNLCVSPALGGALSWREARGCPISRCGVEGLSVGLKDGCTMYRGPHVMVATESDDHKDQLKRVLVSLIFANNVPELSCGDNRNGEEHVCNESHNGELMLGEGHRKRQCGDVFGSMRLGSHHRPSLWYPGH